MKKKKKNLFILVLFIVLSINPAKAVDYFWRGGSGAWDNINHWVDGAGFPRVTLPDATDDVYFDGNSGLTTGNNLLIIPNNATCRNIKFEDCPAAPQILLQGNMYIYGSLQLQAGMEQLNHRYTNYFIYFLSATTGNEIRTNNVPLHVKFQFDGAGDWTLKDQLVLESQDGESTYQRGITVNNGTLILDDMQYAGFYLKAYGAAKLSMLNTTVNTVCWEYYSSVPLVASSTAGSTINFAYDTNYWEATALAWLKTNAATDVYNDVIITGGTMPYAIHGGVFNKISFRGANGSISTTFPVVVKDLELHAPGRYELGFWGGAATTLTVNGKLSMVPYGDTGCGGFIELGSFYPGATRPIDYKGGTANFTANRVLIQDIYLMNGMYTVNGLDGGGNYGVTVTPLAGITCNWIGGGGNWNDPVNWSNGCIPTPFDNVIFDNNSGFTAPGEEVLIDMTAYVGDLSFNGTNNPPVLRLNFPIEIYGSTKFQTGMYAKRKEETYTPITAAFNFRSNKAETITMNGVQPHEFPIYFNSLSGTGRWTLQDELAFSTDDVYDVFAHFNGIYHQSGHQNFNGQNISSFRFNSAIDDAWYRSDRSLNIANSIINITTLARSFYEGGWVHQGGQPLTAAQSAGSRIIVDNMSYTFF